MTAVAVAIADSVAAAIGQAVSLTTRDFTLRRSYLEWDLELKGLDLAELSDTEKLHVDVVAHTTEQQIEPKARNCVRYTVPIDIGIRRKFGDAETDQATGRVKVEEIDKLVLLVQELALLFLLNRFSDTIDTVYDQGKGGVSILANPHREHLRELRQFTGIIRVFLQSSQDIVPEVTDD